MDVERNLAGPIVDKNETKVKVNSAHRSVYSKNVLIALRKKAIKPASETIVILKSNAIFRYRGKRAGKYQNQRRKKNENIPVIMGRRPINKRKMNANFQDNQQSELNLNDQ